MPQIPTSFEEFRSLPGIKPYYFGLGFIKARISSSISMNFYDPELGATVGPEEVHDHRYDFMSTVVAGELVNSVFRFTSDPSGSHEVWEEACVEGVEPPNSPMDVGRVDLLVQTRMGPLTSYYMDSNTPHSVDSKIGAITYLVRGNVIKERARVVKPRGTQYACPYARKLSDDEIWLRIKNLYARLDQ